MGSTERSPGLRKIVPNTGTAVKATRSEAIRAKLTVRAKGRKNDPTSP